jgi:hypothetical protein
MTNQIQLNGYPRADNAHEYIADSETREVSAYIYGDGQALFIVQENIDGRWVETANSITSAQIALSALLQFARGF